MLLLNSVPAALRRPQKKQVLDFQSMSYLRNSLVPLNSVPAALRRPQKKQSWISRAMFGGRRPTGNGGFGGAEPPQQGGRRPTGNGGSGGAGKIKKRKKRTAELD